MRSKVKERLAYQRGFQQRKIVSLFENMEVIGIYKTMNHYKSVNCYEL